MKLALLALVLFVTHGTANADGVRDPRDPVHLRAGTLAIQGSRYMKDMLALSKEIDRRTRGTVQLDWVADGQLGEEAAMADAMRASKLDGGGFSETGLFSLVPEMAAWGEPGVFHTYDDVDASTAALATTVRERFTNAKMVFVMWADLGFARVFSREPITDLTKLLGASSDELALPIDGALTSEIHRGTVRTWVLPPLYMLAIGAKAREMTNLRYRYVVGGLVFTRAAWSRLTPAEQTTVLEVCATWEPKIRASWRKETERGIAALEKTGIATHAASELEIAAFVETTAARRTASTKNAQLTKLRGQIKSTLER